jgi:hypothetical protein
MVGGAKRKNETHAAKASKATKVDIKNLKNSTKEQLISKLQALQGENEALREENETKTDKIDVLERKIETMQHKEIPSKVVSVQTEDLERMWCIECEYYFCGNHFRTKEDLIVHRKKAHAERVRLCKIYEKGCCDRGDSDCWFSHDKTAKKTPETYNCSICEHIFGNRSEFMHHRKKEHSETVPK